MYPLHAAAVNSWQHCKTNQNALNAVQCSLWALKKRGCKNLLTDYVSWRDWIQTAANPDQAISGWTPGPNFSFSAAWATGHRLRDLQAVWKMPLIIMLKHFFFSFYFCHGCRRRAKQSPEVSIISPQTPGTGEITLYLLSHKVTVKVWWREHTVALMWCWIPRNTSDASSPPAARTKLHF